MKSIREKQREWKRQEIINAVMDIALKEGILELSIEEISKKSGFAKSSIYYYFKSKDEIFKEIVISGWEKMLSKIKSVKIDLDSPCESLIEVIKAHLSFTEEEKKLFQFLSRFTKALRNKEVEKYLKQENEIYLSLIEECVEKGILKGDVKFIFNSLAGSVKQIAQNEELTFQEKLNFILKNLEEFRK